MFIRRNSFSSERGRLLEILIDKGEKGSPRERIVKKIISNKIDLLDIHSFISQKLSCIFPSMAHFKPLRWENPLKRWFLSDEKN